MDIDLRQALDDIATDARTPYPSPDELWREGRRRRSRRRALGAVGAVAVVAAVLGGTQLVGAGLNRSTPPVASPTSRAAMPDRLFAPSPWIHGTEQDGPPGRIAVVVWDNARRRTLTGASQGYIAVSAVDGSYRYLDAPGLRVDGNDSGIVQPSLSPDGRYVAYEVHGAGYGGRMVSGWRVYDAETGKVRSLSAPDSPKGLGPGRPVVWTPDSRVALLPRCEVTVADAEQTGCTSVGSLAWSIASGDSWEVPGVLTDDVVGTAGDDGLLVLDRRRVGVLDVRTGEVEVRGRVAVPQSGTVRAALSPDGRRLTMLTTLRRDDLEGSQVLLTAAVSGGARGVPAKPVQRAEVRGSYVETVAVGDGRALVLRSRPESPDTEPARLVSVDAVGRTTEAVTLDPGMPVAELVVAADLAAGPFVDAVEPQWPSDPRKAPAVALLVLAGGWLVVRRVRRRRVARWSAARA